MKKIILLVMVSMSMTFVSCEKCIECTVVYTPQSNGPNPGEKHTNEFCDDISLSEAEMITAGQEAGGQIEAGWSCK